MPLFKVGSVINKSIMKQLNKKYNDEDNMLVNDLRSIVSKARSKAFAAVNYSLVERNWRIGQRIVEQEQNKDRG